MSYDLVLTYGAGHGLFTAGKRCLKSLDPKETREWWLNQRIANYVEQGLEEYERVKFVRVDDRTGKRDIPLGERVRQINKIKPHLHIDNHHDAGANGGTAGGITVYVATKSSSASQKFQKAMYNSLIRTTGLKGNRASGTRSANFYMVRMTNCPAILIENGFMDSRIDVPVILTDKFARENAKGQIDFLVSEFKLTKKKGASTPSSKPSIAPPKNTGGSAMTVYRYGNKGAGVKTLQANLKTLDYDLAVDGSFGKETLASVKKFQKDNKLVVDGLAGKATQNKLVELIKLKAVKPNKKYYRVQVGAFGVKSNADKKLAEIKSKGFTDAFIKYD